MPKRRLSIYGETPSLQFSFFAVDQFNNPPAGPFYMNGYFETYKSENDQRKLAFCKRPGAIRAVDAGLTNLTGLTNGHKINGVISSLNRTRCIFYTNNGVTNRCYYFDGTNLTDRGVAPAAAGSWSASTPVVFTHLDGISYGSGNYYAATDFTKGAVISDTGVWTEITDADFTGLSKVTNFCAMDGYLFIGTADNRIYNSELNAATTWVSTSFISANDTPGALLWLSRIRNYVVAFKQNSIEFFEDTGNPTPGSPLTAQKQLNRTVGLVSKSSVREVSDGIIFAGITTNRKINIYKLKSSDLSLEIISNQYMDQILSRYISSQAVYNVDATQSTVSFESQVIYYRSKELYLISLQLNSVGPIDRTYVFDNGLQTWSQWATCTTGNNTLDSNFTPWQSVVLESSGVQYTLMAQNSLVTAGTPPFFVCFKASSDIFGDSYLDSANSTYAFPMVWISDLQDMNSRNRKFLDSVEVLYDTVYSAASGTETMTLYYADSDYNVTSPNVLITRTTTYPTNNAQRCIFRRLGSFRKRWFGLRITDASKVLPFRLWGVELSYNEGETEQES